MMLVSVIIIMILPGIIAACLHCKLHGLMHKKKVLGYFITYTIGINILIAGILWLVGIQKFNLFEVSLAFKLGWLISGVVLAVALAWFFNSYSRINWAKVKRVIPVALFLTITYVIFAPSSLFLENINEFYIKYSVVAPVIFLPALVLFSGILCVGYLIPERYLIFYTSLVFGVSLSVYVQMNFLNAKLPTLDGTEIDWSLYTNEAVISTVFWILCLFVCVITVWRWKQKTEKAEKYISYFLSAVQMVSLVVLLMTNRLDPEWEYGFSKEGEFSVGSSENIIIFVVDCLQPSSLEEYISSTAYASQLNDFTFFDNAVSGGAPTVVAMPVLLTGVEYDPMQDIEEYGDEIWQETLLYDDLTEKGYDIRFYTTPASIPTPSDIENAHNMVSNYTITRSDWIDDYVNFGKQFYKLVNFYTMPQILKAHYWLSTESIMNTISSADDKYVEDNYAFYCDMRAAKKLTESYDKAFRLYHLYGVHKPYITNENIEEVYENTVTEQQQLQGVMKEIYLYMDMMKENGVYDSSMIVILGDHGQHEIGSAEVNPAVLIKLPHESHDVLQHNSSPVHFRNVVATIAGTVIEDYSPYGPGVYDITKKSDVERLHTFRGEVGERMGLKGDLNTYHRIIVSDNVRENKYQIWNPHEINRINYEIGSIIDFANQNDYAEKLNYRLYKENGTAIASNELSMCFELQNYQDTDLEFHFTYSNVYNDTQKIRIYANGKSIENVICKNGNTEEKSVIIPKDTINEDELIIRMVFPNAITPNQIDRSNPDTRVLSVAFESMWLRESKSE